MAAILASSPGAAQRMRRLLADAEHSVFNAHELLDRFEQFFQESEQIVPAAANALATRDLGRFGELVHRSQALTTALLHNQVPETLGLLDSAIEFGAVAASPFGAGFGGSVWALVLSDNAVDFLGRWSIHYRQRFPEQAERARFFITDAGPAAFEV